MTDDPLLGSVDPGRSIELPYGPPSGPTIPPDVRVRRLLGAVWLVLFAASLGYVLRYALVNPFVDEWAFVPALFGDEPAGPWLWALHNEHRFPLPRVLYLGLFRLTGDLRAGCLVSLLGMALLAAGLMRLARTVRGRADWADAVFPLLLLHPGQGENLYMGYQMCFMLVAVLAGGLLAVIVLSCPHHPWEVPVGRQCGADLGAGGDLPRKLSTTLGAGVLAGLLGFSLLTCGAAGLAYGSAVAGWVLYLAVRGGMSPWQRLVLVVMAAATPAYIAVYSQGYARPGHHPPSAGVIPSAWVGLEAQGMAFGPAATGLWPVTAFGILLAAGWVVAGLAGRALRSSGNPRFVGLLLFVAAGGAVAFGIGWGRSGIDPDMGFAWRYGWLTLPPVFAAYFTCLAGGGRVSSYGPRLLAVIALVVAPVNVVSGFLDAEAKVRPREQGIEADVRAGHTAAEVAARRFPDYPPAVRAEVADAMRRMREHGYAYYRSLGREGP